MTFSSITALFGTMLVLAFVPSVSVLTVSVRSASYGFTHGVFTTLGIVVGDIAFIVLAIYGLSFISELTGNHFILVKYLGGTYLIWLGFALWRSKSKAGGVDAGSDPSLLSSFLAGLLITLGDQKAILFYLGFLPAFLDLTTVSFFDTSIIIAVATVSIAGPKLFYAFLANRAGKIIGNSRAAKGLNIFAGSILITVGILLMTKA